MRKKLIKERAGKLLPEFFEINGDVATIDLYYDSFEDLISQSFGAKDVCMMNQTFFQDVTDAFNLLPNRYYVKLRLNVRDLGQYSTDRAKEILENNIALKAYSIGLTELRKNLINLSTIGGGALILLLSYFLLRENVPAIIYDVVNITGTLFIWEATSSMLLEGNYEKSQAALLVKKIRSIVISTSDGRQAEFQVQRKKKTGKQEDKA